MVVEFIEKNYYEEIPAEVMEKIATKPCDDATTLEAVRELYNKRWQGGLTNAQVEQIMVYWGDSAHCYMRIDLYEHMLIVTYDFGLDDKRVHIYETR